MIKNIFSGIGFLALAAVLVAAGYWLANNGAGGLQNFAGNGTVIFSNPAAATQAPMIQNPLATATQPAPIAATQEPPATVQPAAVQPVATEPPGAAVLVPMVPAIDPTFAAACAAGREAGRRISPGCPAATVPAVGR